MMALTDGRLTGRPGVCFVTRGPGATNAAHGVHIAEHDWAPMMLFVGQVERAMRGRGAFQEMDYRAVFGSTAKWATEIDDAGAHARNHPARLPHRDAGPPRPGRRRAARGRARPRRREVADAPRAEPRRSGPARPRWPNCRRCCGRRERPIVIVGGGGWTRARRRGAAALRRALRSAGRRLVPPRQPRRQRPSRISSARSASAVNPKLKARIEEADLVLLIGGRMVGNGVAGLHAVRHPRAAPGARPRPCRRRRRSAASIIRALGIVATPPAFGAALEGLQPPNAISWSERDARRRAPSISPGASSRRPIPGEVQLGEIMLDAAPARRRTRSSPTAPAISPSGPAASCASAASTSSSGRPPARWASAFRRRSPPSALYPERTVVCFAGDGDFLMNGQEFATAVQYDLPIVVVVIDNGMYGTIRMHQEREYPGRVSGDRSCATPISPPTPAPSAAMAKRSRRRPSSRPRSSARCARGKPAILHVKVDPEAITPTTTLSAIRRGRAAAAAPAR